MDHKTDGRSPIQNHVNLDPKYSYIDVPVNHTHYTNKIIFLSATLFSPYTLALICWLTINNLSKESKETLFLWVSYDSCFYGAPSG